MLNGIDIYKSDIPYRNERSDKPLREGQILISYSHQDKEWLERLQVHLKPFELRNIIRIWDDIRLKLETYGMKKLKKHFTQRKLRFS